MRWFWVGGRWLSAEDDVMGALRESDFALQILRRTHERLSRRENRRARKRIEKSLEPHPEMAPERVATSDASAAAGESGRRD